MTDTVVRDSAGTREPASETPPTRTLRVAVVNGSPSEKSKTMGLADVALQTLRDVLGRRGILRTPARPGGSCGLTRTRCHRQRDGEGERGGEYGADARDGTG